VSVIGSSKDAEVHYAWGSIPGRRPPSAFRGLLSRAAEAWTGPPLLLTLPGGQALRFEGTSRAPGVELHIVDFRALRRILMAGDIGFAEGYICGDWDTPDLSALLRAFSSNFDGLERLMSGHPLTRALNFLSHALKGNSRRGARRNIAKHYDLGNDFYELWLDQGMTYSSALFEDPDQTLEAAQEAKFAALAASMDLRADHHVLEIGCGWGGFSEFAGRVIGARVTAITISKAQFDHARRRMFEAGLADRVDVKLLDYRDVEGRFDRIASIEMFEAVGEAYWPDYFAKIRDGLKPGGRAGLQIITIDDALFDGYRARPDFIQSYIFPGGMLASETRLGTEIAAAGLKIDARRGFAQDYAATLKLWGERFERRWSEIEAQGFDERFRRLWRYYLSYCEAGFATGRTDVVQIGVSLG
jgi:cyclopropane-fatty-acyl-phospholipid synthase